MKISVIRFAVLSTLVACFSFGIAGATTITVNDPSFESGAGGGLPLGCGTSCSYSEAPVPGWNGGSGQFQPGPPNTTAYFNYIPDGITVGYTNGSPLTQTVGVTVQDGVTYTLQVDIGTRNDLGFGGAAELIIGGTDIVAASGTPAGAGGWATYTATFTGDSTTAGKTIEIALLDTAAQGDFDDVRLSSNGSSSVASSVPEPGSMSLLALGLCSLGCATQWRKMKLAF